MRPRASRPGRPCFAQFNDPNDFNVILFRTFARRSCLRPDPPAETTRVSLKPRPLAGFAFDLKPSTLLTIRKAIVSRRFPCPAGREEYGILWYNVQRSTLAE